MKTSWRDLMKNSASAVLVIGGAVVVCYIGYFIHKEVARRDADQEERFVQQEKRLKQEDAQNAAQIKVLDAMTARLADPTEKLDAVEETANEAKGRVEVLDKKVENQSTQIVSNKEDADKKIEDNKGKIVENKSGLEKLLEEIAEIREAQKANIPQQDQAESLEEKLERHLKEAELIKKIQQAQGGSSDSEMEKFKEETREGLEELGKQIQTINDFLKKKAD